MAVQAALDIIYRWFPFIIPSGVAATFHDLHKTSSHLQLRLLSLPSLLILPARSSIAISQSLSHQGSVTCLEHHLRTQHKAFGFTHDGITLSAIPINETLQIQAPGSLIGTIAFNSSLRWSSVHSSYYSASSATQHNVHNSRQDLCPPRWPTGDIRAQGILPAKRRTEPMPTPHAPQIR